MFALFSPISAGICHPSTYEDFKQYNNKHTKTKNTWMLSVIWTTGGSNDNDTNRNGNYSTKIRLVKEIKKLEVTVL